MADKPRLGHCEPEDLPHEQVLEIARAYLGPLISQASPWIPLTGRSNLFD